MNLQYCLSNFFLKKIKMHDIKFIKENSKFFDEQLQKRGLPPQANKILMYMNCTLSY